MSQPAADQYPSPVDPNDSGNRPEQEGKQAPKRKTRRSVERRFELGFFVRKVVNGRVVRHWHFPPTKRTDQPVPKPPPRPAAPEAPRDQPPTTGEDEAVARTLALSTADSGDVASTDDGSTTEETSTTYEVGFFLRTSSTPEGDDDGPIDLTDPKK